jgi:hypothetical protein
VIVNVNPMLLFHSSYEMDLKQEFIKLFSTVISNAYCIQLAFYSNTLVTRAYQRLDISPIPPKDHSLRRHKFKTRPNKQCRPEESSDHDADILSKKCVIEQEEIHAEMQIQEMNHLMMNTKNKWLPPRYPFVKSSKAVLIPVVSLC